MADLPLVDDDTQTDDDATPSSAGPRRGPGHRAADARDTAAEMAQRAHEISLEAGSRMAGAMRSVVGAAAGLNPFYIDSARDLINYMVRRGQMNQEEADALIEQAEAAYIAVHGSLPKPEPKPAPPKPIPLGQLPKAVTAPAAAAEAALEARAAMRIEPQKPSDRIVFAPLPPKPAPKPAVKPVAKTTEPPAHAAAPAPAARKQVAAAPKPAAKAAAKVPEKSTPKTTGLKASAKTATPKSAPAKPASKTAKQASKSSSGSKASPKAAGKAAAKLSKAPSKAPAKTAKPAAKPAAKGGSAKAQGKKR